MNTINYAVDGDDLMALRIATKALIRELQVHIHMNESCGIKSTNPHWENRIVELKDLLDRTDWGKVEIVNR